MENSKAVIQKRGRSHLFHWEILVFWIAGRLREVSAHECATVSQQLG